VFLGAYAGGGDEEWVVVHGWIFSGESEAETKFAAEWQDRNALSGGFS
jgi:hypothetical protein